MERLKQMHKFCKGLAHNWDIHEIGLARKEKELQEQLDEIRLQHDTVNQVNIYLLFCVYI